MCPSKLNAGVQTYQLLLRGQLAGAYGVCSLYATAHMLCRMHQLDYRHQHLMPKLHTFSYQFARCMMESTIVLHMGQILASFIMHPFAQAKQVQK